MMKHVILSVVLSLGGALLSTEAQHQADNTAPAQRELPAAKVDVKSVVRSLSQRTRPAT